MTSSLLKRCRGSTRRPGGRHEVSQFVAPGSRKLQRAGYTHSRKLQPPSSMQAAAFMRFLCALASTLTTAALAPTDFQAQLSLLHQAAEGVEPPLDKFPHARSTSRFGEILWRSTDAARARNALTTLGSNPLATATASAYSVLAALESPELVERRISARRDLLTPKRSPDFEGVLLTFVSRRALGSPRLRGRRGRI